MGKKLTKYTRESCISFCASVDTIAEIRSLSMSRYQFIIDNHLEDECFAGKPDFSEEHSSKYPKEYLRKISSECKTREELKERDPGAFKAIYYRKMTSECFKHMERPARKKKEQTEEEKKEAPGFYAHTLEECRALCLQYKTRGELKQEHNNIYQYVVVHGWRQECFGHMRRTGSKEDAEPAVVIDGYKKRTLEECMSEAMQYDSIPELRVQNKNLYSFIIRHQLEEVCFASLPPEEADQKERTKRSAVTRRERIEIPPEITGPSQRLTYKFRIPHTEAIDNYMRVANNLYNQTLYTFRSEFERPDGRWMQLGELRKTVSKATNLEGTINYDLMPNDHMAEKVVETVFSHCVMWANKLRRHKPGEPFPHLPGYRERGGMFVLRATRKNSRIRKGVLSLSKDLKIDIPDYATYAVRLRYYVMATLIPKPSYIEVALMYDQAITPAAPDIDEASYAAIDLGIDNLVTMVDQYQTTIYHGRFLKSYNQYFNKQLQHLQRIADAQHIDWRSQYTHKMHTLWDNRNAYVADVMHKISRHIVDYLVSRRIGTLIVGWNGDIKQRMHLTRNVRRMFHLIPYGQLIDKLRYKCEAAGINFMTTEESYTSKCDALALEPVCHHDEYAGRRVKRGLFRSSTGRYINADVNAALNIMRLVIGDCTFIQDIINSGHLFCPVGYGNPFQWKSSKTRTDRAGC